jgi:hypothetical protein
MGTRYRFASRRSQFDVHVVLGETLFKPLEVGSLHHREMIQVLKAWITALPPARPRGAHQRLPPLWTLLVFVTAVFAVVLAAVLAR